MPTEAALGHLCSFTTALAHQLLPAFIADRLPLTDAQWALIPIAPLPGLCRILPAALACSVDQAGQLVRRLPLADAQRLRTAALCLAARPHLSEHSSEPLHLPAVAVSHILSLLLC